MSHFLRCDGMCCTFTIKDSLDCVYVPELFCIVLISHQQSSCGERSLHSTSVSSSEYCVASTHSGSFNHQEFSESPEVLIPLEGMSAGFSAPGQYLQYWGGMRLQMEVYSVCNMVFDRLSPFSIASLDPAESCLGVGVARRIAQV